MKESKKAIKLPRKKSGQKSSLHSLASLHSLDTVDSGVDLGTDALDSLASLHSLDTVDSGVDLGTDALDSLASLHSLDTVDSGVDIRRDTLFSAVPTNISSPEEEHCALEISLRASPTPEEASCKVSSQDNLGLRSLRYQSSQSIFYQKEFSSAPPRGSHPTATPFFPELTPASSDPTPSPTPVSSSATSLAFLGSSFPSGASPLPVSASPSLAAAPFPSSSAASADPFLSQSILTWYDKNHRTFPWRIPPGEILTPPCPYKIWISETMLQQTGTLTVVPYFNRFMASFPTVHDLAAASIEEVLLHWQGLGYYRRAHHLHRAAQIIANKGMPENYDQWLALPGIGPYTAAAITALGHNQPAVAVDGNIRRVFSRYFGLDTGDWEKEIWRRAALALPSSRWGDYTQALMDLGATVCQSRNPTCALCPLQPQCHAHASGQPTHWPPKTAKISKKQLFGHVYVVFDDPSEDFSREWSEKSSSALPAPQNLFEDDRSLPSPDFTSNPSSPLNPPSLPRASHSSSVDCSTQDLHKKENPTPAPYGGEEKKTCVWLCPPLDQGLLKGLWRFPGSPWQDTWPEHHPLRDLSSFSPVDLGIVSHIFTHISLKLRVWMVAGAESTKKHLEGKVPNLHQNFSQDFTSFSRAKNPLEGTSEDQRTRSPSVSMDEEALEEESQDQRTRVDEDWHGQWVPLSRMSTYPLSRLMQKVLHRALSYERKGNSTEDHRKTL